MKKLVHIALTLVLLISTSGMKLAAHYCHDTLTEVNVGENDHSCCGDDCNRCADEYVIIDLDADLVVAAQNTFQLNIFYFPELFMVNTMLQIQEETAANKQTSRYRISIPTKTRLAKIQRYLC